MERAQLLSFVLLIPIVAISLVPHWALWGVPSGNPFPLWLIALFVVSIVVHEALHGLGYRWGGAASSDVDFGFNWQGMAPYAHCSAALRANPYRLAIALPGLVLGGVPLGMGLLLGSWNLTMYAFLMLLAAAGDAILLWMMREISGDRWIQDHPTEMGCLVLGHPSSAEAPVLAVELEDDTSDKSEDGVAWTTLIYGFLLAALVGAAVGVFGYMIVGS
jgi:hypothetical protein